MTDKWVVLDAEDLPIFDNVDDAESFAGDSARAKVVVPVTYPDYGHHATYNAVHEWALETNDPQNKGKKYSHRYDKPGETFEDKRSIPQSVIDAYYDHAGKSAENGG